eukprot:5071134-Pleurochrysis_carterae.AAC.1
MHVRAFAQGGVPLVIYDATAPKLPMLVFSQLNNAKVGAKRVRACACVRVRVRACACACVRARVRACACVCVRARARA